MYASREDSGETLWIGRLVQALLPAHAISSKMLCTYCYIELTLDLDAVIANQSSLFKLSQFHSDRFSQKIDAICVG